MFLRATAIARRSPLPPGRSPPARPATPPPARRRPGTCAACHGADGNETLDDTYPKLAGQYPEYLAKSLHDYKSGKRKNAS